MKGYTLLFTLCISSLAVCNPQRFSSRASDEPGPNPDPYSTELKTRFVFPDTKLTGRDIIKQDRKYARSSSSDQPPDSSPVANNLIAVTTIDVEIGDGSYKLFVDTFTANIWIGANTTHPYRPSGSSTNTGQSVVVSYGIEEVASGEEFIDIMQLPGIKGQFMQSIGVASSTKITTGFDGHDGVLGIGRSVQTVGILSPNTTEVIPTIPQNLAKDNIIQKNLVGVLMTPANETGRLDWGSINNESLISDVKFVPITNQPVFNTTFSVDVSITVGESQIFEGPCLVQSTEPLTLLPHPAWEKYIEVTGAVQDQSNGFLRVNDSSQLQNMTYHIGESDYELVPDAQIWPTAINSMIDGEQDGIYLIIADAIATNVCTMGLTYMQRHYVVLDDDNGMVGFAQTNYTFAVLNEIRSP